ncbi:hypothetical protein FQA47_021385 [Oryzias melastigma]|uniref:Uncharacterized protein n=1 Tax=Oryzias melastigma TaxID=30732 RepID=A0A834CJ14_ORYME|nr:hypothetical protein FQA47_021385 [Oryzias melastigma]
MDSQSELPAHYGSAPPVTGLPPSDLLPVTISTEWRGSADAAPGVCVVEAGGLDGRCPPRPNPLSRSF